MENSTKFSGVLHTQELYTGQPQIVGAERGAGCENTHARISTQPGRSYGRGPALADGFGKLPDDPQMGEFLNTPEGIGIPEFRLKNDGAAQFLHQTALTGDTELGGKIAVHPGNDLNIYIHYLRPSFPLGKGYREN